MHKPEDIKRWGVERFLDAAAPEHAFYFGVEFSEEENKRMDDIWIAATALYLDMELHTADNDFDHLTALGLRLTKYRFHASDNRITNLI